MSHILEQTDDRLVIRLSSTLGLTSALFTLDRSAQSIHIEKTNLFTPAEPFDFAVSEVSRIECQAYPGEDAASQAIRLEFQSGDRQWIRGSDATATADAAIRMRDFFQLQPSFDV